MILVVMLIFDEAYNKGFDKIDRFPKEIASTIWIMIITLFIALNLILLLNQKIYDKTKNSEIMFDFSKRPQDSFELH